MHERQTLEAAKDNQFIYDTLAASPDLFTDQGKKVQAFQNFIIFLMLSTHSNEKVDLLNIVQAKYARELDANQDTEGLAKYLRRFLSTELLPFDAQTIEAQVKHFTPFDEKQTENAQGHMQEFLRQLIQHNIRTI